MIAIIDYDAGNLKSVEKALILFNQDIVVTRDPEVILGADKVILPGVGAFKDAMEKLHHYNLVDTIHEVVKRHIPLLGICLGLQLLFESSDEAPGVDGLGILKGEILRIPPKEGLKIPHMGWNSLEIKPETRLFKNIPNHSYVYFVHSYYLNAQDKNVVAATTSYSVTIHAAIESGNVFGCQFHPEKSSEIGLTILRNFAEL